MKRRLLLLRLARGGVIGALYAALTLAVYPLSFGAVQLRFSEALCVLPFVFPEAVPGLFVGCIIANLLSPNIVALDVVFGSLATLIAAALTARMRHAALAPLPPVLVNAVVVGSLLTFTAGAGSLFPLWPLNCLTVALGEAVACYALGLPLLAILLKIKDKHGSNLLD